MKDLFNIDNPALVLSLTFSDTKPRLWYYKDASGNKSYVLCGIKLITYRHDDAAWGIQGVFFPFLLTIAFPKLIRFLEKRKECKQQY